MIHDLRLHHEGREEPTRGVPGDVAMETPDTYHKKSKHCQPRASYAYLTPRLELTRIRIKLQDQMAAAAADLLHITSQRVLRPDDGAVPFPRTLVQDIGVMAMQMHGVSDESHVSKQWSTGIQSKHTRQACSC